MPVAILIGALAVGIQVAQAQADGADGEDSVVGRLQDLDARLESINASSENAFWMSFGIGMGVAMFAVLATFWYSRQLKKSTEHLEKQATHAEKQAGHSEKQLEIARKDAKGRLRPMLSWADHDGGNPIEVTGYSGRPQAFMVRVVNSGEAAAMDIIVNMEARVVGNDGKRGAPTPSVVRMGSLEPHKSTEVRIPASAETIARAMAGETVYVEATFAYSMGGTREFRYRVAGYFSNTMSFLFKALDEEVPRSGTEPEIPDNASRDVADTGVPARPGAGGGAAGGLLSRLGDIAERRHSGLGSAFSAVARGDEQGGRTRPGDDPAKAAVHKKRGLDLHARGKHAEALEELLQAENLARPDAQTLYAKADALDKMGRYDAEIDTLGSILVRDEGNIDVDARIASLCVTLGHYDAAYSALSRIQMQDANYDACMDMATVSMALRKYDQAIVDFDGAIRARPDDPDAHYGKGVTQMNRGCDEETPVTLQRAANLDPARADAHVSVAHALLMLGRRDEAVAALGRAVDASPGDQRVRVNVGKIMMDLSRREEAREAFAEARRLDPSLLVPMDAAAGDGDEGVSGSAGESKDEA